PVCSLPFSSSRLHPDLHSFPTRRSSDLEAPGDRIVGGTLDGCHNTNRLVLLDCLLLRWRQADGNHRRRMGSRARRGAPTNEHDRSEEHTSELQSHLNLVCRLLLEKKNKE